MFLVTRDTVKKRALIFQNSDIIVAHVHE